MTICNYTICIDEMYTFSYLPCTTENQIWKKISWFKLNLKTEENKDISNSIN